MYRFNVEKAGRGRRVDHILVASIFFLTGLGIVTLYSSSYTYAQRFMDDGLYLIVRQLVFMGVGIFLFFIVSRINLDMIRQWGLPGLFIIVSVILCILPFIPGIGVTRNGAPRWFRVGSETFQPSELVKLALPLYLAHIFDKKKEHINTLTKGILPPFFITLLFIIIIALQNNFSTATFIAFNAVLIFYLAGVKYRYFLSGALLFMPFALLLILTREHRLTRILSFLNPTWDPHGAGYHVRASIMTIESGGFWGKGIGHGIRKVSSVPEIQSDFIFAAFAEEMGFIGIFLFFVLFSVFIMRGYRASMRAEDAFRRLLAFGLVSELASQTLANISVVAGIIPVTGIPLPFFSSGGSSLITTFIAVGIVVNISRSKEKEEKEFAEMKSGLRYNSSGA